MYLQSTPESRRLTPLNSAFVRALMSGSLPGSAQGVADFRPGLRVQGSCHPVVAGSFVSPDLLDDHAAQTCKNGCGHNTQHHRFRFFSHAAILVTPGRGGQRRQALVPAAVGRSLGTISAVTAGCPRRIGLNRVCAPLPVEWLCKLAERPHAVQTMQFTTVFNPVSITLFECG